jgi:hypothetical protein
MATKHAFGIYAGRPAARFGHLDCQGDVSTTPCDTLPEDWHGMVTVEAATVEFGRHGPEHAFAAVIDAYGRRGFGRSSDEAFNEAVMTSGAVGLQVVRRENGSLAY